MSRFLLVLRVIGKVFAWFFIGILGLVLLIAFAIQLPPVRALIRDQILAAANGSIQGKIELEDVRWPSLEHLEISGLTLRDRKGNRAASLSSLTVNINLTSLPGMIDVRSVEVSNLYVDLADLGDERGLLSLFASDKPEPEKPKDPNAAMSPISVAIRELCVEHGEVHVEPSEDQDIDVRQLDGCVRLRIAQGFYVATNALQARIVRNDKELALLRHSADLPELTDTQSLSKLLLGVDAKLEVIAGGMSFDAWVKGRGFSPETLKALDIQTDALKGGINLDLHARQMSEVLSYRAQIFSKAGRIAANGELDAQRILTAHVLSSQLKPAAVSSVDLPPLGFALDAQAALGDPKQIELRADLTRGYFDTWKLPTVKAQVVQRKGGSTLLQNVEVQYGTASVIGSGELAPDGALQGTVLVVAPELAALPPLAAAGAPVRGDVTVQLEVKRDARELWDGHMRLSSNALGASGTQIQDTKLDVHLNGLIARPILLADLRMAEAASGGQVFTQVGLNIAGGPQKYSFRAHADEEKLAAKGWLAPSGITHEAWDAGMDLEAVFPQGKLDARIPKLHLVPGESVQVNNVLATFVNAKVTADGLIAFKGPDSKLRVAAEVPDMTKLLAALGQQELPGRLRFDGVVQGELERPQADLELRYTKGPTFNGEPSRVDLQLHAQAAKGTSKLTLQASAGAARLDSSVDSSWSRKLPLAAAMKVAQHELKASVRDASLAALLDPRSPLPSSVLDGLVQGDITGKGNLQKIDLEAEIKSRLRLARDRRSFDVVIKTDYRDAQAKLSVDAGDRRGQLFNLRAAVGIDVEQQLKKPTPPKDLINASQWEMSSELSERRLGELPFLASQDLDPTLAPLFVGLKAQLGHAPHTEPSGTMESQVRWEPQRAVKAASTTTNAPLTTLNTQAVHTCGPGVRGRALLAAKWADEKLGVELSGGADSNETLQVHARARVPFSELLNGGLKDFAGVQLAAKIRELKLQETPWLCAHGAGQLSVDGEATDVLTPKAKVALHLSTKALVWEDSPELNLDLETSTAAKSLLVSGKMQAGSGSTNIDGRLPVDVHASKPEYMVLRSDPVELDLNMRRMPMATLLAPVSAVARVSGSTSGEVRVRGSIDKPVVKGELELSDVSFTLPRAGQRFSHLHLKAAVDGTTVRLSEGRVKDLDGSASVAALIQMPSLDNIKAEVNLNARNFPLRKSGLIMGRVDADAKLNAEVTAQKTQVGVTLNNVAIVLSSDSVGDVQSLDPHPDFSFVDARVTAEDVKQAAANIAAEDAPPPPPIEIHVVSKDGVWVRRDDFAVEMQTDITATIAKGTPRLQGEIELLRGYISLFGQSFDIKRGRVVLAGGEAIDPQLEITAQHDTPGGSRVRVEVTGFARAPELAFYVDDKAVTARDALVAITGGGRGGGNGGSAEQQIASAAIGMTTGLLTLGARREFGDWVPMLAIEQGDNTRVRVGVEADRFIPKFLSGFVRGAYVEGIVASQSTNSTQQTTSSANATNTASGTGVLLELMLPKHFVWAGQYGPGTAWSIDLDWRP